MITYELPLAKSYVSHWSTPEAIRELLQNAIDSDSPFEFEFIEYFSGMFQLRIHSRFTTLQPSSLVLGVTSKAGNNDKIGSFGEGYKIALLVLTRENKSVTIYNGEDTWLPVLRESQQFKTEVLHICSDKAISPNEGLTFEINGLNHPEVNTIKASCLQMQDDIGKVHNVPQGQILLDKPGMLYVGGLFVCDTKLSYGYNVSPGHLQLERDRQTVAGFDLQWLAKEMWFQTEKWDSVAELISQGTPDLEYANYGTPELIKEACYARFQAEYPDGVVCKNQADLEGLLKRGFTKTVFVEKSTYANIITSSNSYVRTAPVIEEIKPQDLLHTWLKANRSNMRKDAIVSFKQLFSTAVSWKLK